MARLCSIDRFTARSEALAGDLTTGRHAKPVVDLALHPADAGLLRARTRLLEGVLDQHIPPALMVGPRGSLVPRPVWQLVGLHAAALPLGVRLRRIGRRDKSDRSAWQSG